MKQLLEFLQKTHVKDTSDSIDIIKDITVDKLLNSDYEKPIKINDISLYANQYTLKRLLPVDFSILKSKLIQVFKAVENPAFTDIEIRRGSNYNIFEIGFYEDTLIVEYNYMGGRDRWINGKTSRMIEEEQALKLLSK